MIDGNPILWARRMTPGARYLWARFIDWEITEWYGGLPNPRTGGLRYDNYTQGVREFYANLAAILEAVRIHEGDSEPRRTW